MNVEVGDKIRFSTELLKHIDQMPDRQTETVVVEEIREDGEFKTLVLRCIPK